MSSDLDRRPAETKPAWLPPASSPADNPHMTVAFARAYEKVATRIMGPIAWSAIERLGELGRDAKVLDIGAGSGALSIPLAHSGASVTAIDIAPGMIELLAERLAPLPSAQARVMDGQALTFAEGSFDAAVSIMGVTLFPDWLTGLSEQARVLRPGGKSVVATWRTLPGGGPFVIMAEALRVVFPDTPPPAPPAGFLKLADPGALANALANVGLVEVEVEEIEAVWEGPSGSAYLEELQEFHPFMGPHARLDVEGKARLDAAILAAVDRRTVDGRLVLKTSVTLAKGLKR